MVVEIIGGTGNIVPCCCFGGRSSTWSRSMAGGYCWRWRVNRRWLVTNRTCFYNQAISSSVIENRLVSAGNKVIYHVDKAERARIDFYKGWAHELARIKHKRHARIMSDSLPTTKRAKTTNARCSRRSLGPLCSADSTDVYVSLFLRSMSVRTLLRMDRAIYRTT